MHRNQALSRIHYSILCLTGGLEDLFVFFSNTTEENALIDGALY